MNGQWCRYGEPEEAYGIWDRLRSKARAYRESIRCFVQEVRTAKGGARIDLAGRIGLFIPAIASIAIIILVLTFLWYESAPILTSPEGGAGIILETTWDPNRDLYGIGIFIAGSFMCTFLAIALAVPLGIGAAIFLSEFCPHRIRSVLRMIIEMMAAIPSIVYGLWAYVVLVPFIKYQFAPAVQSNPLTAWMPWFSGQSNGLGLLAGGVILAIMLLPTVVAVSDDALRSVPNSYREASLALGATTSETARGVVLSAAIPGIGAAVILSLGRAVGETMAVLMVTGNSLQIAYSLFDPMYVMTSIITNQLGYAYTFDLWRSALFSVALILMLMSILFTAAAKLIIKWGMRTRGME
ncbi:phosphate ABC transporter permease subunit PstC [Candidatus Thorarchaeota archaeon]|nr:MAG: phosphate ABC transporter permease subunit PstC [Candidatus Thorarchaeota archaeon]